VPSTIVDGTADPPRVLRAGAVSLDRLREVLPDVVAPDEATASTPSPRPSN
jgi:L-threonylcarbamoyladenylate synthase